LNQTELIARLDSIHQLTVVTTMASSLGPDDFWVQCPAELVEESSTHAHTYPSQNPVYKNKPAIFMAGGISGTLDWQQAIRAQLRERCPELLLVNPRRENFDTSKPEETDWQIQWEHRHLRACDAILFW
jgi:Nucleoside 2-deoxyribosyltransferase like